MDFTQYAASPTSMSDYHSQIRYTNPEMRRTSQTQKSLTGEYVPLPKLKKNQKFKSLESTKNEQSTNIQRVPEVFSSKIIDNHKIQPRATKTNFYRELIKARSGSELRDDQMKSINQRLIRAKNQPLYSEDGSILSKASLLKNFDQIQQFSLHTSVRQESERSNLMILKNWILQMTEQVAQQDIFLEDFYNQIESVYQQAFQELKVMIQPRCCDHAQLMETMWDTYSSLVRQIMQQHNSRNKTLEKDSLQESSRLHNMYQTTLNDRTTNLIETQRNLSNIKHQSERLTKENKYLKKQLKTFEKNITILKGDRDVLQQKLTDLQQELEVRNMFKQDLEIGNDKMEVNYEEQMYHIKREIFTHFKQVFENSTQKMEETYQRKLFQLERDYKNDEDDALLIDDVNQVLFVDASVGTSDAVSYADSSCSTRDIIYTLNKEVQAGREVRLKQVAVQTFISQESREIQVDIKVLRRENKPRSHQERLLQTYSREPIKNHLLQYNKMVLPQESIKFTQEQFKELLEIQTKVLGQRLEEIFSILKFKDELYTEDFEETSLFIRGSYGFFFDLIYYLKAKHQEKLIIIKDKDIQIFELQLDIGEKDKEIQKLKQLVIRLKKDELKLNQNSKKTKFIEQKHEQLPPQLPINFTEHTITFNKVAPRNRQSLALSHNTVNLLHASDTHLTPMGSLQTIDIKLKDQDTSQIMEDSAEYHDDGRSIKQITHEGAESMNMSQRFVESQTFIEEPQIIDETSIDINQLINPLKYLNGFEKRLFIARSKSKFTAVSTKILIDEHMHFKKTRTDGVVKQMTLYKYFVQFHQFLIKNNNYSKEFYPYHVALYDFMNVDLAAQGRDLISMKFGRMIRSLLFYRGKGSKNNYIYSLINGEIPSQPYIFLLNKTLNKGHQINQAETGFSCQEAQINIALAELYAYYDVDFNNIFRNETNSFIEDFDQMAFNHLKEFQRLREIMLQKRYYNVVSMLDEDQQTKIDFNKLSFIFGQIEGEQKLSIIKTIFNQEYDIIQDGIRFVSHQRLFQILWEQNLLSEEQQKVYVEANQSILEIKSNWIEIQRTQKLLLIRSNSYSAQLKTYFEILGNHLEAKDLSQNQKLQTILIKRYLDTVTKQYVLDHEIQDCLSSHFHVFQSIYKYLQKS